MNSCRVISILVRGVLLVWQKVTPLKPDTHAVDPDNLDLLLEVINQISLKYNNKKILINLRSKPLKTWECVDNRFWVCHTLSRSGHWRWFCLEFILERSTPYINLLQMLLVPKFTLIGLILSTDKQNSLNNSVTRVKCPVWWGVRFDGVIRYVMPCLEVTWMKWIIVFNGLKVRKFVIMYSQRAYLHGSRYWATIPGRFGRWPEDSEGWNRGGVRPWIC